MGADIYLTWDGMTKADKENQLTGFDVTCGKYGYLRGAYNGHVGYDALLILFKGIDWEQKWKVDVGILTANFEKLKKTLFKTAKNKFYHKGGVDLEIESYYDFVGLAQKLVLEKKKPTVRFSF